MGGANSSEKSKSNSRKKQQSVPESKQDDNPWDIAELSEHRLNNTEYERILFEAINAYWDEVLLQSIRNNESTESKQNDINNDNEPLQNESNDALGNNDKNLTNKVIFGDMSKKSKRKNLEYFTSDVYEEWTWPLFIDQIIEKQSNLAPIYERSMYHFTMKFDQIKNENEDLFKYHDSKTLAKNEFYEFLWIFIGFQYYLTKSCEYTLGDDMVIFDFLSKLSILFKAIMIGYDYEQYAYNKVLNHFMKPCLSNINKEILNRAQTISIRKGLKKNENECKDEYRAMRQVYQTIIRRMEACRAKLAENGIEMKKL